MRCYICSREDSLIHYDHVRREYGPCTVCEAIIQETLEEFGDPETEDYIEVDYPECGQDDLPYGESIESECSGV